MNFKSGQNTERNCVLLSFAYEVEDLFLTMIFLVCAVSFIDRISIAHLFPFAADFFRVRFFEFCHRLKEKVFVHFWTFIHSAAKWSISTCFHPLKWPCSVTTAPRGCAAVSQVFNCNSVECFSCVINPDPASQPRSVQASTSTCSPSKTCKDTFKGNEEENIGVPATFHFPLFMFGAQHLLRVRTPPPPLIPLRWSGL